MVQRLFFDRCSKVLLRLGEVSLQEPESTQGEQDLSISWILGVCSHECIFDIGEVEVARLIICKLLVVRVIFEPLVHVAERVLLGQLIRKADAEG